MTTSKLVGNTAQTEKRKPPNAGKGRPKGVPNKMTTAAKEALAMAFDGIGGVPALIEWAQENRDEFYRIWSKLLPLDHNLNTPAGGVLLRAVLEFPEPKHQGDE